MYNVVSHMEIIETLDSHLNIWSSKNTLKKKKEGIGIVIAVTLSFFEL